MGDISLIDIFKNSLETSGFFDITIVKNNLNMYEISLRKIKEYKLHIFLRKITYAGWSDKPEKRRVQVSSFDLSKLPASGGSVTCMIIGVQELFDRYIFVAWNIYEYGSHATNRSCYVHTTSIYNGFLKGYLSRVDQSQKIWVSDGYNLDKLILDYMDFNYSSLGE